MKYASENKTTYSVRKDSVQIVSADKEEVKARGAKFLGYYHYDISEKIREAVASGKIRTLSEIVENIVNFPLLEPKTRTGGVVVFWENEHLARSKPIVKIEEQ